ncbi:predicted protein [Naegleria gruberi]|uniref:Predicted protein n=1 Tax=Naegleria gruberi TaxID=5762 RepID=D2VL44_NAEGR|nr:uncharacterized protein NAEGRDRAFT_50458 [Naegleria gruberi]EFC42476.1 predicted protein [Naegleria gruberi]|eukprot:XP_002675220.1 predicted protein [Naegleria gruberi strain NEG-M]
MSSTTTTTIAKKLFTPLKLGGSKITLSHRVAMAPLTRSRAFAGDCEVPELGQLYYSQRSTEGGLIVSEATQISREGQGYPTTPGIYSDAQVESWKKVLEKVHQKGGAMFCQLWHVGRLRWEGAVSASETPLLETKMTDLANLQSGINNVLPKPPRALTLEEIKRVVADFGKGAKNAKAAGFDGVELHGANGYLIDQFLRDGINKRTDGYGGSIKNRLRFLQEVLEETAKHFDSGRIGVRLSPYSTLYEMSDSTGKELWEEAAKLLNSYDLAYLHVMEPKGAGEAFVAAELRPHFKNPIMVNTGFDAETGEAIVQKGHADLVSFGRPFIANPDLVYRMKNNLPLNQVDYQTLYYSPNVSGGYTDYPTYEQTQK